MNNLFPIFLSFSFLFPGILEAYAAFKFLPFVKYRGGLIMLIFFSMSAQFDILFSGLMFLVIALGANFVVDLPWSNPIVVAIVSYLVLSLFLWRAASGVIAVYSFNKKTEPLLRKLLGIPEKSDREEDKNMDNEEVLAGLRTALSNLRIAKPKDGSDLDRRYAIMITDQEKIIAYYEHFVMAPSQ